MTTTTFRNIHVRAAAPAPTVEPDALPKLRFVTNDPAREYEQRAGDVDRLPDSVAALILSKQGFSKVSRNGIRIEGLAKKPLTFWCENSVTIATKAGTNEKVLWTVNREQPDVLHILTPDGEYVESIPLQGRVPWFDAEATEKQLGAVRRANGRRMERIRHLHAPDAEAALEREQANAAAITGVVHTFPTASRNGDRPQTSRTNERTSASRSGRGNLSPGAAPARPSFGRADRIHEIQRDLEQQRADHSERQSAIARRVAEVTDEDINLLTNSGADCVDAAVPTATRGTAEEDASDWVL